MEFNEMTSSGRASTGRKFRKLAVGVLASVALCGAGMSAVTVVAVQAGKSAPVRVTPASHRVALANVTPNSLRVT